MAEVTSIKPNVLVPRQPNEDLVNRLKNLLAMAERGELMSIAYVGFRDDGAMNYSWAKGNDSRELVAGVSRLWFEVMTADRKQNLDGN